MKIGEASRWNGPISIYALLKEPEKKGL